MSRTPITPLGPGLDIVEKPKFKKTKEEAILRGHRRPIPGSGRTNMTTDDEDKGPSYLKIIPGGKPKPPSEFEHFADIIPVIIPILQSLGMPKPLTPEETRAKEEHAAWERFALAALSGGNGYVSSISCAYELLEEWKKRRPDMK